MDDNGDIGGSFNASGDVDLEADADKADMLFTIGSSESECESECEKVELEVDESVDQSNCVPSGTEIAPLPSNSTDIIPSKPEVSLKVEVDPSASTVGVENDTNNATSPSGLYIVYELKQQLTSLRENFIDRGLQVDNLQEALKLERIEKVIVVYIYVHY